VRADIRIASDDSQFGIPAARLGLGPRFTSVAALVGLVGPAWAAEILFTARRQKPSRWDWSTASCRPRICAMR
jgi:enoyl-CoA hydratase